MDATLTFFFIIWATRLTLLPLGPLKFSHLGALLEAIAIRLEALLKATIGAVRSQRSSHSSRAASAGFSRSAPWQRRPRHGPSAGALQSDAPCLHEAGWGYVSLTF